MSLVRRLSPLQTRRTSQQHSSDGRFASARLTGHRLSYKMSYMKRPSISIRELQQNLRRVMARVERGQVIEVTRHRRLVARLAPMRPRGSLAPWPDLDARARAVFGDRIVAPGAAEVVIESRGER